MTTTELIRLYPGDSIGVDPGELRGPDGCILIRILRGPAYRKAHPAPKAGEKLAKLLEAKPVKMRRVKKVKR